MHTFPLPFPKDVQLNSALDGINKDEDWKELRLPGQPNIRLGQHERLWHHLERELYSADLEKLAPHLWMMSTQSSANISPLHRQKVKNRRIIITEDPRLHLVWVDDKIFIKPLPPYLLSHAFWAEILQPCSGPTTTTTTTTSNASPNSTTASHRTAIALAARGFLRTYSHLIRHESDFRIALDEQLIPPPPVFTSTPSSDIPITWTTFADFTASISSLVNDADVSPRYAYGELRLSRLNFYAKLFLRRFYYQRRFPQYGTYFAQFFAPILFVFGTLSVVLGAMQVMTATEALLLPDGAVWPGLWMVCRWFSVLTLVLVVGVCVVLGVLLGYRFVSEWCYAIRDRRGKRRRVGWVGKEAGAMV
ncbi:uncharacterized protein LTHEOB_11030 [Lasiodiplodia theobromae]|uniref:uncharacterized protein n=1 Tax=Lasiodiplodia theobromae TaxID=45133 RepID=UPI0015C2D077|nr:uncharacterized protein LTHEOB_11030 [Lasiodiplodia theobromae]KAF4538082.1 hypothetical protein LTHEOB_11030 [Lasiodiplodia theobromae]